MRVLVLLDGSSGYEERFTHCALDLHTNDAFAPVVVEGIRHAVSLAERIRIVQAVSQVREERKKTWPRL